SATWYGSLEDPLLNRFTLASLALTVGLLTVFLCLQEANRREIDSQVQPGRGAEVFTFRLKLGASQAPRWTPQHLDYLGRLDGVYRVEWQGGTLISQSADARHVIPLVEGSVGVLDVKAASLVAGRTFTVADVDQPHVALGTSTARALFGTASNSHIGEQVVVGGETLRVVGVIDGVDGAYRVVSTPTDRFGNGNYDIDAVYVVMESSTSAIPVLRTLEQYLAQDPDLEMLEAVRYREFVAGGMTLERVAFLRESGQLFGLLVALVVAFGAIDLAVGTSFAANRRIGRWAVLRALGASRRALLRSEIAPVSVSAVAASVIGVIGGSLVAPHLGGVAAPRTLLLAIAVGLSAAVLGTLPAVLVALRLHPAPALRSGIVLRSGARLAFASTACLVLAFALPLTAGGIYRTGESHLRNDLEAI